MVSITAKFHCTEIVHHEGGSKSVKMRAVMGDTPANKGFNDFTPSGNIEFMIAPEKPAAHYFEPGEDYHLEFTKAVK